MVRRIPRRYRQAGRFEILWKHRSNIHHCSFAFHNRFAGWSSPYGSCVGSRDGDDLFRKIRHGKSNFVQ